MLKDIELFTKIHSELELGNKVVLCTVLEGSGSVPRGAGAKMAVFSGGTSCGTVGGGSVEQMSQKHAAEVLSTSVDDVVRYGLQGSGSDTGMVCGGEVAIGFLWLGLEQRDAIKKLIDILAANHKAQLKLCFDGSEPKISICAQNGTKPQLIGSCYTEPVCHRESVCIFGGGHVGEALAKILPMVDFCVTVFDNRPEYAVRERFPDAQEVILGDYRDIAKTFTIRQSDYVVIMTHGHEADLDVLVQALRAHPKYVGCMGSSKKTSFIRKQLREQGFLADEIDAVHLPIGVPILSQTPAEIAISITAELIRFREESKEGETNV